MVQVIGIIAQFINADNGIFHSPHNNAHIPRNHVRRPEKPAPIKGGRACTSINKQYRPQGAICVAFRFAYFVGRLQVYLANGFGCIRLVLIPVYPGAVFHRCR